MTAKDKLKKYIKHINEKSKIDEYLDQFLIYEKKSKSKNYDSNEILAFLRQYCLDWHLIDILTPNRSTTPKHLRYSAMKLIFDNCKINKYQLSRLFKQDHATILNALKKHEELIVYDDYKQIFEELENALKKL